MAERSAAGMCGNAQELSPVAWHAETKSQREHGSPVAEGLPQAGLQPDLSLTALSPACMLQALCQSWLQWSSVPGLPWVMPGAAWAAGASPMEGRQGPAAALSSAGRTAHGHTTGKHGLATLLGGRSGLKLLARLGQCPLSMQRLQDGTLG